MTNNTWRWLIYWIYDSSRRKKGLTVGSLRFINRAITYSYGISKPLFTIRWWKAPEGVPDYYGIGRGCFFTWYGFGYWENKPRYIKDWSQEMRGGKI